MKKREKNHLEGRLTILIVDDHAVVRTALCDLISSHYPGSHILEAGDGDEAVTMAKDEKPDLILMDINMPRLNGLEATRRIKLIHPHMKVVMISLNEGTMHEVAAKSVGASAYVLKNEVGTDLLPVLNNMLETTAKN